MYANMFLHARSAMLTTQMLLLIVHIATRNAAVVGKKTTAVYTECSPHPLLKGELNVDKKWQSDDLFYIIMNEVRPRVDQF